MNLSVLAASGYGKSYITQAIAERNTERYDHVVLLDYKDEYRGLCSKDHGPAPFKNWMAGPVELQVGPGKWAEMIEQNGHVVIARHPSQIDNDEWREIAAAIVTAARHHVDGSTLIVLDEAHFLAPQAGAYPDPIKGLATTGRGEGNSAAWVTQRTAEIDKTVLGQSTARFVGGFTGDNDIRPFRDVLDYPAEAHISGGHEVPGLPEELHADDEGAVSVRKWAERQPDGSKQVFDSEWIYSDDDGDHKRLRSADAFSPSCDHVGASGMQIDLGL